MRARDSATKRAPEESVPHAKRGVKATQFVALHSSTLPFQVDLLEKGAEGGGMTGVVLLSSVLNAVRRLRGLHVCGVGPVESTVVC